MQSRVAIYAVLWISLEMNSKMVVIQEEMKKLQASNEEILALLKKDDSGAREWSNRIVVKCKTHNYLLPAATERTYVSLYLESIYVDIPCLFKITVVLANICSTIKSGI